jgi:hypothetical protein
MFLYSTIGFEHSLHAGEQLLHASGLITDEAQYTTLVPIIFVECFF